MANLRERWRIRKLCRSYNCVVDRCREREQVVVKRTGPEIDILRRQILLNACENVSLCRRGLKAQQYQNDRREADSQPIDNKTDEPWPSQLSFHVPPVSPVCASIDPIATCGEGVSWAGPENVTPRMWTRNHASSETVGKDAGQLGAKKEELRRIVDPEQQRDHTPCSS